MTKIKEVEGEILAKPYSFCIIVSRFNEALTKKLKENAIKCLLKHGAKETKIKVIYVPGALEIPLVAQKVASKKKYNVIICLGCVIKGETAHFDQVAAGSTHGLLQASLKTRCPMIFGILTTNTVEQAVNRCGINKRLNKGWEAALNAMEMASLHSKL